MAKVIDQKSYLQKYLGGPSVDKKKKKKKNVKGKGFKIIDDDLDLSKLRPLDGDELDILNEGEDAPQIAGIIDERPEELRKLDQFSNASKWRVITQDDGFNSKLKVQEVKRSLKEVEKENELVFGKMYSDSEDEKKNDSDVSPPRKGDKNNFKSKKTNDKNNDSRNKRRNNSDSDANPPRKGDKIIESNKKNDKNHDSDISPPRKNRKRNNSDSDASPPRRNQVSDKLKSKNNDSDLSSARKHSNDSRKRQSDSDASPPRRKEVSTNRNKPRKPSRWGTFEEEEKKSRQRSESPKSSSKTVKRRDSPTNHSKGYNSDMSPPRKSRRDSTNRYRSPDSDVSPPRRKKSDKNDRYHKDKSSPKRRKHKTSGTKTRHESDSDLSPPRQERNKNYDNRIITIDSDSDVSPPRKERNKHHQQRRDKRRNSDEPPPTNKKMERTLDGKKAGLQDAEKLKEENEAFRRREEEVFRNMTDEMSGRNAKIVSRKGKRETSEDRQKQREKAERQKLLDEKYKKWSKGLKQIESQQAAMEDFIHEASKPLARYKDDRDLESNLKDIERQGDPMLQYIRERKRERGELGPEKPTYKGNFPPNRFNIRPGYRWDGVDRSNGYEKKYFDQQSKRKAQQEELYKWSTEDL